MNTTRLCGMNVDVPCNLNNNLAMQSQHNPATQREHTLTTQYERPPPVLQALLEAEIASECPRNGEVLVRMVDKPFLSEQDLKQEIGSWAI
jgi:hypothetical protein